MSESGSDKSLMSHVQKKCVQFWRFSVNLDQNEFPYKHLHQKKRKRNYTTVTNCEIMNIYIIEHDDVISDVVSPQRTLVRFTTSSVLEHNNLNTTLTTLSSWYQTQWCSAEQCSVFVTDRHDRDPDTTLTDQLNGYITLCVYFLFRCDGISTTYDMVCHRERF